MLGFNAPIVAISMTSQPGTRKYLIISLKTADNKRGWSAATVDLDTQTGAAFYPGYQHFCGGTIVLGDGSTLIMGGHSGSTGLPEGLQVMSYFHPATNSMSFIRNMHYRRWYPTPLRLASGKVLIVGGTQNVGVGPPAPVAELFDPNDSSFTLDIPQPPVFAAAAGNNWYPFISLLPRGEILWWGDRAGSITDSYYNVLLNLPLLPATYKFRTMYRFTATIAADALRPDANGDYNTYSFIIFGGAPMGATDGNTPACPFSARLDFWYCATAPGGICTSKWVIEEMPGRRVMGDSIVLPNGKIVVHGGAQSGLAGQRQNTGVYNALNPATRDFVYDPMAPVNSRFKETAPIGIIRLYHSSACLDVTGKILAAGCEACGVPLPGDDANPNPEGDLDRRLTIGTPSEIGTDIERPVITFAPDFISRGAEFEVSYTYGGSITGASMAAPCATTHSINTNQRVILLVVVSNENGIVRLRAPPTWQPSVAPYGYYMLFLLGDMTSNGNTYSEGHWFQLQDA